MHISPKIKRPWKTFLVQSRFRPIFVAIFKLVLL